MRFIVLAALISLTAISCSSPPENKPAGGLSTGVTNAVNESVTTLKEPVNDLLKEPEVPVAQTPATNIDDSSAGLSEVTETTILGQTSESTIPSINETTTTTSSTTTTTVVTQVDDDFLTVEPYRPDDFDESVEPSA